MTTPGKEAMAAALLLAESEGWIWESTTTRKIAAALEAFGAAREYPQRRDIVRLLEERDALRARNEKLVEAVVATWPCVDPSMPECTNARHHRVRAILATDAKAGEDAHDG